MDSKWYQVFRVLLSPPLFIWNRPSLKGRENIPREGAAIMASNHQAVLDSFYLPMMTWRRVTFLAKKEYFTAPGVWGAFKKFFFTSVGQIPIDREAENAAESLQEAAKRVLAEGRLLGIYPEGTRSPDGRLYKARTGTARIAMGTNADVIPVAMFGTRKANPIGTSFPRPYKVRIKVGEPIKPHEWARENGYDPNSREVMRPFSDHIMKKLQELTGSPYVDVYASEVKKSLEQGKGYPEGTEPQD